MGTGGPTTPRNDASIALSKKGDESLNKQDKIAQLIEKFKKIKGIPENEKASTRVWPNRASDLGRSMELHPVSEGLTGGLGSRKKLGNKCHSRQVLDIVSEKRRGDKSVSSNPFDLEEMEDDNLHTMRTLEGDQFKAMVDGQRSISPIRRDNSKEPAEKPKKSKVNFI